MFCTKCGAKISEHDKFCVHCGEPQPVYEEKNLENENTDKLVSEAEQILEEAQKAVVSPVLELPDEVVEEIKETVEEKASVADAPLAPELDAEAPQADFEIVDTDVTEQPASDSQDEQVSSQGYYVPPKKKNTGKIIAIVLIAIAVLGAVIAGVSMIGGKSYKSSEAVMDAYFECLENNDVEGIIEIMEPTYTELMMLYSGYDAETYLKNYDYAFYAGYAGMKIEDIEYEYMISATEEEIEEMVLYLEPEDEWQAAENYYAYVTFEDGTEEYFDIITVKAGNKYMILQVN